MSSPNQHRAAVKVADHQHAAEVAVERRHGLATELRKERRHEQVGKRRRTIDPSALSCTDDSHTTLADDEHTPFPTSESDLLSLLSSLHSLSTSPPSTRLPLLTQLKTLLLHPSAPISFLVERGVIALLLVELTSAQWTAENQVEAVWCLTNIAADSYANTVQVLPASPYLISMLAQHSHPQLQEQAAWTLGNLAGEDQATRRTLIQQGTIAPLIHLYNQQRSVQGGGSGAAQLQHIVAWALSNLFKSREVPSEAVLAPPFLANVYGDWNGGEQHVAVEVSWVLCHLAQHSQELLLGLVQQGLVDALRTKLEAASAASQHPPHSASSSTPSDAMEGTSVAGRRVSLPSTSVPAATFIPLIRIVANLALLPSSPVVSLFEAAAPGSSIPASAPSPVLLFLRSCLTSTHRGVRKEAAWAISSLATAGHPLVVSSILQAQMLPPLLHLFHFGIFDQQREVAFALYHLALSFPPSSLRAVLAEHGRQTVATFLNLLRVGEPESCDCCLRMVRLVCEVARREGEPWLRWVEEEGGIEALEGLPSHERGQLWDMAQAMLEQFWEGEDEGFGEEAGAEPLTQAQQQAAAVDMSDIPPWRLEAMRKSQQLLAQQQAGGK